jgi:hypothetical protein
MAKPFGKLVVCAHDAGALVGIDLSGRGDPPYASRRIVVEKYLSLHRDPSGKFQGGMVDDEEVHARGKDDLEGLRSLTRPPCRDVEAAVAARSPNSVMHLVLAQFMFGECLVAHVASLFGVLA